MSDEAPEDPLALARDPGAPAATLDRMLRALFSPAKALGLDWHHPQRQELLDALARNPSTPIETLVELAKKAKGLWTTLLENPSFELYLMVNPGLQATIANRHLKAMLASPRAPSALVEQLAHRVLSTNRDPRELDPIVRHPNVTQPVLDRCACERNPAIRALVAGRASPALAAQLARLEALDPSLSADDLERAMQLGGQPASLVADHPAATAGQLARLARSDDAGVRRAVAAHPSAAVETLEQLTATASERAALCCNPSAPPELLRRVLHDPATLDQLAQRLLRRPEARPEAVRALLGASNDQTRALACRHPLRPSALLDRLIAAGFADDLSQAPEAAPDDEALLLEALELGPWFHELVVGWMPLPERAQLALARSSWAARDLAWAPGLLPSAAEALGQHPDPRARIALLEGPGAPAAVVERLIEHDTVARVLEAALVHPLAPDDAPRRVLARVPTEALLEKMRLPPLNLLLEIVRAHDPGPVVAYLRTRASIEQLIVFSEHESWRLRRAVIDHPELPAALRERLASDPHASVREGVEQWRQRQEREARWRR